MNNPELTLSHEDYTEFHNSLTDTPEIKTLPNAGIATALKHTSYFKPITLECDDKSTIIFPIGGRDFIVLENNTETAWFVPEDIAETHVCFPNLEQTLKDDETSYKYQFNNNAPYDQDTAVARLNPDPVQRPDEQVTVTHLTLTNNIGVPFEWHGKTHDGKPFYLRSRSGTIQAKYGGDTGVDGELLFHAFIGREFPGTPLKKHEIINMIDSLDYISVNADLPEVPEEELKELMLTDDPYEKLVEELSDDDNIFIDE